MQNESLPLPVVSVMHASVRIGNWSAVKPTVQFEVTTLKKMNKSIAEWAYKVVKNTSGEQMWSANILNYFYLDNDNITLQNAKQRWPLKAEAAGSPNYGITVIASVNATNFIEYPDMDNNYDYIEISISNFETDAPSDSNIKFQLLPCEKIDIVVALEHYTSINRPENPCRDDYPDGLLKALLKLPMHPTDLNNPIFAPDLPYSEYTCNAMCHTNYWLPKCNCYVYDEIWLYAGKPGQTMVCPRRAENCTSSEETIHKTPISEIYQCKCYPKCSGYRFRLAAHDKMNFGIGM